MGNPSRDCYIFGVKCAGKDVMLDEVKGILNNLKPRKVALELPQDYLGRVESGYSPDFYFLYPLASYLLKKGVTVVPLETPEKWKRGEALLRAFDMTKIGYRGYMEMCLKGINRQVEWGQKSKQFYTFYAERMEAAFEIMDSHPDIEKQKELLASHAEGEESRFLANTRNGKMEAIVVDNRHARRMAPHLPTYMYIKPL